MPTARLAAFAILAGLLAPAAAGAAPVDEQVKAAFAAVDAAFNKHDAQAMGAFFAPDGVLLPPTHEVFNGPEGVTKFFSGIFAAGWTGHHLELIEAQGDERGAFAAARWSAQGKDDKGELKPFGGFTTTIFEKQPDGGLKVKLLTFN